MNADSKHGKPMGNINLAKRQTLKTFSVLGATAAVATVSPGLLAGSDCGGFRENQALRKKLHVTLISKPAESHDYIKIENLTDKPVSIEGFDVGELQFDGAIIDCNDACTNSPVRIDASSDVLLRFQPGTTRNSLGAYKARNSSRVLNVQSRITRFSEGTRIVTVPADLLDDRVLMFAS